MRHPDKKEGKRVQKEQDHCSIAYLVQSFQYRCIFFKDMRYSLEETATLSGQEF